jgi:N-acetylmuramoyl-L-alanine amidase
MSRPIFLTYMLCVGLTLSGWKTIWADEPTFNTVHVEGQRYVNLADFVRYYKLTERTQTGEHYTLKAKTKRFSFKLNSGEAQLNGIRIWLNAAPIEFQNSILISEIDVRKTLDPILRPWAIQKRKVKTIMIDPGHGGEDMGTEGYRGTKEKRYSLDLAGRVEKRLRTAGFKTLMTRRTDTYISLEDRSELTNSSEADLFVSIHFNSAKPNSQANGIETYALTPAGLYSTGSIRKRLGLGNFSAEPGNRFDRQNMLLAYSVQQKITEQISTVEDRGVKYARFFVIKATERPSILVESGFLSNPTEEKRIMSEGYRDTLAQAIVEGIKRYAALMNVE